MNVNTSNRKTSIKLTKKELNAIATASETYRTLAKFSDDETAARLEQAATIGWETIKAVEIKWEDEPQLEETGAGLEQ